MLHFIITQPQLNAHIFIDNRSVSGNSKVV